MNRIEKNPYFLLLWLLEDPSFYVAIFPLIFFIFSFVAPHNPHAFRTLSFIYDEKGDIEKSLQVMIYITWVMLVLNTIECNMKLGSR